MTAQGRALGRRTALAAGLAFLALAVLLAPGVTSTSGGQREQRIAGATFTSTIGARWTVRARMGAFGFETFALGSNAARLDPAGVPPAGAIGITITESSVSALSPGVRDVLEPDATRPGTSSGASAAAAAAIELMSRVVRTPAGAVDVEASEPPRYRTLAGARAAEASYEYVYSGRGNVQVDIVARRGAKIYFIELDTELGRLQSGEAVLAALLRSWRWT